MTKPLAGKIAIVTGASEGYGVGIAQALVGAGAKVWITARRQRRLQGVARRLGATAVRADVCVPADWDRVFAAVMDAAGRVDILVNNAGAGIAIEEIAVTTDEAIQKIIDSNLTGAAFGCRRAAQIMKTQRSGTIVNIASVCAVEAWPGFAAYSAAKAGLLQMTRTLYVELRPYGARATCVIPSWGATGFARAAGLRGHAPAVLAKCIQPGELGRIVCDVCTLPEHLAIQEMIVWPLVQEVVPL
jgi:NAD(P)-dependent dehydrogenase (short-subunit alcohol dehydrogenase family)